MYIDGQTVTLTHTYQQKDRQMQTDKKTGTNPQVGKDDQM